MTTGDVRRTCPNDHEVPPGVRVCPTCGAAVPEEASVRAGQAGPPAWAPPPRQWPETRPAPADRPWATPSGPTKRRRWPWVAGGVAAVLLVGAIAGIAGAVGGSRSTSGSGRGEDSAWMHDLASHLSNRKLSDIVIPGSHDTGTYSLDPAINDDAITQSEDLIHQLDDGAREFDIRVRATKGGYYLNHGEAVSPWLRLNRIF